MAERTIVSRSTAGIPGPAPLPIHGYLPDGHIRLLELDIDSGGAIAGSLHTVKAGNTRPYFALSYVCGNEASNHKILIDSKPFMVKPNLHCALKILCSYFRRERHLKALVWIDAICIDQGDEQEKARQIRNMHDVFSGAQEVLVCLGPVPDEVDLFLHVLAWSELYTGLENELAPQQLKKLHDYIGFGGNDSLWIEATRWAFKRLNRLVSSSSLLSGLERHRRSVDMVKWMGHVDQGTAGTVARFLSTTRRLESYGQMKPRNLHAMHVFLGKLVEADVVLLESKPEFRSQVEPILEMPGLSKDLSRLNHQFWAAIPVFIRHEWFQRVWTLQEILLACKARVFAKDVDVDWRALVDQMRSLLPLADDNELLQRLDPTMKGVRAAEHPVETVAHSGAWRLYSSTNGDPKVSLYYLMVITASRRATVAKDNIYGLLALLPVWERDKIIVDYTKPDAEVMADATKIALTASNDLWSMGSYNISIANLWEIHFLWESSRQAKPTTEDLPSWCPDLRGQVNPVPLTIGGAGVVVWDQFSLNVKRKPAPRLCYDVSLSFRLLGLKVLKLDTIARCMSTPCPLSIHDVLRTSTYKSERKQAAARRRAFIQWLLELQNTFPPRNRDLGSLARNLEEFLYRNRKPGRTIKSVSDFSATLTCKLIIATGAKTPITKEEDIAIGESFAILLAQRHRYLFETTAGRIGYSARPPMPGSQLVFVSGASLIHMLSAESTGYIGCASVDGLMGDALLDVLDSRQNDWEMVCLE